MENDREARPFVKEEQYMSDNIKELAVALAKCQGSLAPAKKDASNPFFNIKYADLASVWESCRKPLSDNGLSVVQLSQPCDTGLSLQTLMLHTSGQWIKSIMKMTPVRNDPQGSGSCLTYMRRYSLMAIVGIAPEDDDANAASKKPEASKSAKKTTKAKPKARFPHPTKQIDHAMLMKMFNDDQKEYSEGLQLMTNWTNDAGDDVDGIKSLKAIKSDKQAMMIHSVIKKEYIAWAVLMEELTYEGLKESLEMKETIENKS